MAPREAGGYSLQKYGFLFPIVTDKDLLVADGQQKAEVALEHDLPLVKVLRVPAGDIDRRILRQVLNKLRGTHDPDLDAKEFLRVIDAGERGTLKNLLAISDRELSKLIYQGTESPKIEKEPADVPIGPGDKPRNQELQSDRQLHNLQHKPAKQDVDDRPRAAGER